LLLDRLAHTDARRARFVCVLIALRSAADPEPLIALGRWDGEILREARGVGGFGYDPHHSIVRASQEGLSSVMFKPFKVDQLLEEVRKALGPKPAPKPPQGQPTK
jgi:XTP/dITP diphosphohydrolase